MDVSHLLIFTLSLRVAKCALRDFAICHDDFSLKPPDGVLTVYTFPWLGFAQYLHVITGLPHHSKAPRVVLIHKQFAVGTATDLLRLPKNYKLGHIVFGDYERVEEDCGLTRTQVKMGVACSRAYIEIPFLGVTPHPEYSRFGVGNSLALVKLLRPVKSEYMIPICLPTVVERERLKINKLVFMVDYISSVPSDFDSERMGKKTLKIYTHRECKSHGMKTSFGREDLTHVLCSSGCGVRPGAPIVSHTAEGTFQLIGIAAGGAPCARLSMRQKLNTEPPLYIDVYPYVSWIINVISAHVIPKPYPESLEVFEGSMSYNSFLRAQKKQKSGWKARTFVTGNSCFRSLNKPMATTFFYSEKFEVNVEPPAMLNIVMKISAGVECTITCARLLLPNHLTDPVIEGVGGYNITITFDTQWLPYSFYFSLGLNGKNTTDRDFVK